MVDYKYIKNITKNSKINDYKEYIDASIPNNGELEIQNWKTYFDDDKTEYVIINAYYDKEDVSNLLSSIQNSNNWVLSTKMKSELKILLPTQFRAQKDVYYSIYSSFFDKILCFLHVGTI